MSAYLSTTIKVRDPEIFEEYAGKAVPVINKHGGETIVMGGVAKLLAGQADHEYEVVIQFPNTAAVEAFYESDEYQALIPLREQGRRRRVQGDRRILSGSQRSPPAP